MTNRIGFHRMGILLPVLFMMLQLTGLAQSKTQPALNKMSSNLETATLGSGCFWCTEAVYLSIKGVHEVVSGYSGGKLKDPTYREVF